MAERGLALVVGATGSGKSTSRAAMIDRRNRSMAHAIAFAETGRLCLRTLHADNASQTLACVIDFSPEERRRQWLTDLSANLRGIVSQRLVRRANGNGRSAAIETLPNTPTIVERILHGEFHETDSASHRASRRSRSPPSRCPPTSKSADTSACRRSTGRGALRGGALRGLAAEAAAREKALDRSRSARAP